MSRKAWSEAQAQAWSQFVRRRMEELQMSMQDVAEAMDVTHASVSFWLSGARRPSPTSNMKLASVLYVDGNRLLELAGHASLPQHDPEREAAKRVIDQLPDADVAEAKSYLTWRLVESRRKAT